MISVWTRSGTEWSRVRKGQMGNFIEGKQERFSEALSVQQPSDFAGPAQSIPKVHRRRISMKLLVAAADFDCLLGGGLELWSK